ncbi:MAG: glycosyltransferase [bacterium]|nr:glycosyltransferase [bacterium]
MKEGSIPKISVIMPVFNAEKYLREAMDSVLNQTFSDFEFIVVNDGSADRSEEIILSYTDRRIVYIRNQTNVGLIATLNNTVLLAKGNYIARMDNDDICDPRRFELQLHYFSEFPKAKMICSPIVMINEFGRETGFWPADRNSSTYQEMVTTLPWENCIAHPTIMIERELLSKYLFSPRQKGSEDWDLWLRLVRDKVRIEKTKEVLLKYRVHQTSITQLYKKRVSSQLKSAAVKLKFVGGSLAQFRINYFVLKTGFTIYKDLGYYVKKKILSLNVRKLKWLFTISLRQAYKQSKLLKSALASANSTHFLFFPYSHLGGAEKVHAGITRLAQAQKPFVFITGLDDTGDYAEQFGQHCTLLRVSKALYHPFFSAKNEILISNKIHSVKDAVVFGCNNLFFYDLLLKLDPSVYAVDLTHDFDYDRDREFALTYLPNYLRCNERIFISNAALQKTIKFYEHHQVSEAFTSRLNLIYNFVDRPAVKETRSEGPPFRVLYVGRDTPEKRVELVFELAALCEKRNLPVEFVCVGPLNKRPNYEQLKNLKSEGIVMDEEKLSGIYGRAHFTIITSESEGFPLTLAEGMVHGCIPLSTAVGDIPFHIQHTVNGLLSYKHAGEEVVLDLFQLLTEITNSKYNLTQMSDSARAYAEQKFDRRTFVSKYQKVLKLN